MYNDLLDNFSIPSNKLVLIENPVDSDLIRKMASAIRCKPKVKSFLFIGRLTEQKGIDYLCDIILKTKESDFVFDILGDGEDEFLLQTLINKEPSLENRLHIHGKVENPYMYMQHADALISTSRYEGLSNVVLESMCLGLPVVAFNCPGGMSSIIKDGANGCIVDAFDTEQFSLILNEFDITEFDRPKISQEAISCWGVDTICEKYRLLFKGAVN